MPDKEKRPLIVKRVKKVQGGGHHGGAWKVAYADFVTAMMAFFLLMWLLNATTDRQRKGLADYFNPTIPIARASAGGDGVLSGRSVVGEDTAVMLGTGGIVETSLHGTSDMSGAAAAAEAALMGKGGESLLDEELQRHVAVRLSDEGLVIELFSLPGRPLFEGGTDSPTEVLRALVPAVGEVLAGRAGRLALAAHVPGEPIVLRAPAVWERSAQRAERLRRMLPSAGLAEGRVARIAGHADRMPADPDPLSIRNDRVEIVLLRPGR